MRNAHRARQVGRVVDEIEVGKDRRRPELCQTDRELLEIAIAPDRQRADPSASTGRPRRQHVASVPALIGEPAQVAEGRALRAAEDVPTIGERRLQPVENADDPHARRFFNNP